MKLWISNEGPVILQKHTNCHRRAEAQMSLAVVKQGPSGERCSLKPCIFSMAGTGIQEDEELELPQIKETTQYIAWGKKVLERVLHKTCILIGKHEQTCSTSLCGLLEQVSTSLWGWRSGSEGRFKQRWSLRAFSTLKAKRDARNEDLASAKPVQFSKATSYLSQNWDQRKSRWALDLSRAGTFSQSSSCWWHHGLQLPSCVEYLNPGLHGRPDENLRRDRVDSGHRGGLGTGSSHK